MRDGGSGFKRGRNFVDQDRFIKEYSRDLLTEYEKAQQIYEIAASSREFEAPRPIRFDTRLSRIEYELMTDPVQSIREVFKAALRRRNDVRPAKTVFESVGRCLARIHQDLRLSTSTMWTVPDELKSDLGDDAFNSLVSDSTSTENVILHGDFGFSNIFVKQGDSPDGARTLWIVDPSPNYFMTFKPDSVGAAEIDLANLVACMRGLLPARDQIGRDWRRASGITDALLNGYESEAGRKIDRSLLRRTADLTLLAYLKTRISNKLLRSFVLRILYARHRKIGS